MKSPDGKPQNGKLQSEKPQNTGALAEKARLLHLRARTLSDSFHSGSSRSFYKGRGADFAGVREYLWGDDVRSIDWNVTARMGRPFIKLFEENRELRLKLEQMRYKNQIIDQLR